MKNVQRILISLLIISLLVVSVSGAGIKEKIVDESGKQQVIVSNVPKELKDKISISGADSSYSVTVDKKSIHITKQESKGEHTKAKCSIDHSTIKSLPGYNGKEFSVLRVVDGQVAGYTIYKTKDVLRGNVVTFDATFSENIVSGMTGQYTKTVSINTLNTTIPFYMVGGTALRVLIDAPGTYIAFNESNISTYPNPSSWLFSWPLNGNANDISGNGRHGTITAAKNAAGRSGVSNTGLYFDGDNDYISYNYTNTLYSANTLLIGYKLNHTVSDSNHIVADYRDPAGTGRTGMYEYETTWLINNGTSATTLNSTTNQGWKYAAYPFSSGQINYIWLGARYSLTYDYAGWLDLAALYNGTLSDDQRRVFSYGYQGITVAPYPTTSRTAIRSSNQSVIPPTTITGVNVQSPTSATKSVTIIGYMTQNGTLVREWDNSTHHKVDMIFTAGSNITSGTLRYQLDTIEDLGAPSLVTNQSGASVSLVGNNLTLNIGSPTTGQSKYFNVSMLSGTIGITGHTPSDLTPEIAIGSSQVFTLTTNGSTNIDWLINGSVMGTDTSTTSGSYTFLGSAAGSYNVTGRITDFQQSWILTVNNESVVAFSPSSSTVTMRNDSIQQFKVQYAEPCDVVWVVNNTTEYVTLDLPYVPMPSMNFYNHLALAQGNSTAPQMPNILINEFNASAQVVANVSITNCTPSTIFNFTLHGLTEGTEYYFVNGSGYVTSSIAGINDTVLNVTGISDGTYYIAHRPLLEPNILISDFNVTAPTVANITITNSTISTRWNITIHDLDIGTRYYFLNDTGVVTYSTAGLNNTYFNVTGISDGIYYITSNHINGVTKRDYNTPLSAYWYNGSRIGTFNITAITDSGQTTWIVTVTDSIGSGNGTAIRDVILVTTFLVAAGAFATGFRRRFK